MYSSEFFLVTFNCLLAEWLKGQTASIAFTEGPEFCFLPQSCHSEYCNFYEQGCCYTKHLKMTSVVINIIYTYGDSDVTSSYHVYAGCFSAILWGRLW